MVHRADERQRLGPVRGVCDGARVQPVPELVAVTIKRGQHERPVEHPRQRDAGRQTLPQPVQVVDVLPAPGVQLLGRAPAPFGACPRCSVSQGQVLCQDQVAVLGGGRQGGVVVDQPHAPVAEALSLAKRVVRLRGRKGEGKGVKSRAAGKGAAAVSGQRVPMNWV
jgi:hypothetical protein